MFRKLLVSCLLLIVMVLNLFTVPAFAATKDDEYNSVAVSKILDKTTVFDLKAKSSILIDELTGSVLLEKNSDEKLSIASITKVMSMLLVMDAIDSGKIKFDDKVIVSDHSYSMGGSQVYLKPGEEFTVDEMLKAVAIHSANDATVALAEKVSGSEDAFVAAMNEKAKEIGMKNTNFLDCTGLTDEGHYSTARDVALMSRELVMKHPQILKYTSTRHDTFRNGRFSLDNTNKLVIFYPGANGLKTGFTTKSGYCLSASAKKNDMQLISVVLGEPDTNTRFAESRKLLDYGFANFEVTKMNLKGEEVRDVKVKKGLKTTIKAVYRDDAMLLLNKADKNKVLRDIVIDENITAPLNAGQKIGEVVYKVDGKEAGRAELVSNSSVEKASFIRLFFRMILDWFRIGRN